MYRHLLACLWFIPSLSNAQPGIAELLEINLSLVQVSVDLRNGTTGTGSGVVIDEEHVATNCHVLANASGVSIAKYGAAHQPVALKADWKHDLCLLKFTKLPFPPVRMRDSASLEYEQKVFVVSYPNDTTVPQPSYGSIKALYPFDGSVIVRSDAAFSLGSSGGALFDQDKNLIGITTFKSPGRNAYYYSLPVEWIRQLLAAPELARLKTDIQPFWSLDEADKPFFMRVVIPYQNEEWAEVLMLGRQWQQQEADNADAYYYIGRAQYELKEAGAHASLSRAVEINPRHLDAQVYLARLAMDKGDKRRARDAIDAVHALQSEEAQVLDERFSTIR